MSFSMTTGLVAVKAVVPVITANSAYADKNCIGPLQAISFGQPDSGPSLPVNSSGSGFLQQIEVIDSSKQAAAMNIWLFDANPTASTFTDKTAPTIDSTDYSKIIGFFQVSTYVQDGGASISVALLPNLVVPFSLGQNSNGDSKSTLYAVAMSNGATPTYTSASALRFKYTVAY